MRILVGCSPGTLGGEARQKKKSPLPSNGIDRRGAEIVKIGGRGKVKAILGLISERGGRAFRWWLRCLLAYYYR
jgi:hypothetical protein